LKMGSFTEFLVSFSNNREFNIYQKNSNGKYFVFRSEEILVFEDRETCINYIQNETQK
jgi:hypothetical protein